MLSERRKINHLSWIMLILFMISGCAGLQYKLHPDWTSFEIPKTVILGNLSLNDIWGTSKENIFAVGDAGNILHYDGNSWSKMKIDEPYSHLYGIWGSGPDDVFVAGQNGTIKHYIGKSWKLVAKNVTGNSLSAIWGTGPDDIFVVGAYGTVLHYNGKKWRDMDTPTNRHLYDIWGTSHDNVFAVGEIGTILKYDGSSWDEMEYPEDGLRIQSIYSVWGPNSNSVFATVGGTVAGGGSVSGGGIIYFDGTSWDYLFESTPSLLLDISGTSYNNIMFVGKSGSVYLYKGGVKERSVMMDANWETMDENIALWNFTGVWFANPEEAYAVNSDGNIYYYKKGSGEIKQQK